MPELALDDVQRHALAQQFECVRVPRLVRGEPSTDPGPASRQARACRERVPDDLLLRANDEGDA